MNNPQGVSPNKGKQGTHVPCFPLLGLTPRGLFMGLSCTLIYTSELILYFTILVIIYNLGRGDHGKIDC